MVVDENKPIETLRISDADKHKLVSAINENSAQVPADANRRRLRVDNNIGQVIVAVTHPNGAHVTFSVVPRNLSANGLAFLHGRFVYAGSVCKLALPRLDGQNTMVAAKIVNCRHLGGVVHEVAVNFEQTIDLTQFVKLDEKAQKRIREEMNQSQITNAVIALPSADGQTKRYWIVPDTISENGLTFIHGLTVPEQSVCELELYNEDQSLGVIPAKVVGCKMLDDTAVEITIAFDQTVDASDPPAAEVFTQGVDAAMNMLDANAPEEKQALGDVLVIDDFASDRALFAVWLRKADMNVFVAGDEIEAKKILAAERIDLIVTDIHIGKTNGLTLTREIRSQGFGGAILAVSAEDTQQMHVATLAAGCNGFLCKPCNGPIMQRAVRQLITSHLAETHATGLIYSNMADDPDMAPLILDFVNNISDHVDKLNHALSASQFTMLSNMVRMLKGAGGSYGFDALTNAAQKALEKIGAADDDPEAIRKAVSQLQSVASRLAADADDPPDNDSAA